MIEDVEMPGDEIPGLGFLSRIDPICTHPCPRWAEIRQKVRFNILPMLQHKVKDHSKALRREHIWLEEFSNPENAFLFAATDREMRSNYLQVAQILLHYTDHRLAEETKSLLVDLLGQEEGTPSPRSLSLSEQEYFNYMVENHIEKCCTSFIEICRDWFKDDEFRREPQTDSIWDLEGLQHLSAKIKHFTHTHCDNLRKQNWTEPWGCLEELRATAARTQSKRNARERELEDCIEQTRTELKTVEEEKTKLLQEHAKYRKTIISLAFRHLMEALPDPTTLKAGVAWKKFWLDAVTQADKNQKPGPVKDLLDSLHPSIWQKQIVDDGQHLYGQYSANIHGFSGMKDIYDVASENTFNFTEKLIVQALKPDPANIDDEDNVDWVAERARFI